MRKISGKIEEVILFFLFSVGALASGLLGIWLLSGFIYVFSDVPYPGDIAFVPKWGFLLSPLVFLGKTKKVGKLLSKIM